MSFSMVHVSRTPRKPWLVSPRCETDQEEEKRRSFSSLWLRRHPFPGVANDKAPWLLKLQDEYNAQLKRDFYMTIAPEGFEVGSDVLMEQAPATMSVQVLVPRSVLEKIAATPPDRFSLPGLDDYQGEDNWEAYLRHALAKQGDMLTLGFIDGCRKTEDIDDVLMNYTRKIGLDCFNTYFQVPEHIREEVAHWGFQDRIGENLYGSVGDRPCVVAAELCLDMPSDPAQHAASQAFLRQLSDLEERSGKMSILVSKDLPAQQRRIEEGIEDEHLSAETSWILWMPMMYKKESERVKRHFQGEGESLNVRWCLRSGRTGGGNLTAAIFEAELNYIKHDLRFGPVKLCAALSLLLEATHWNYWMFDNELEENVLPDLVEDFAAVWRKLLVKSDAELCLGLGGLGADDSGESESRRALYALLKFRADRFETCDGRIAFDWQP